MSSILLAAGTFVLILISLFLMLVILMQRANSSGGLGTAFGGGMAESAFGTDTGNVLTKFTIWAAVAFFILSLSLYLGYMYTSASAKVEKATDTLPVIETVEHAETAETAGVAEADAVAGDAVADMAVESDAVEADAAQAVEVPVQEEAVTQ